MGKKMKLGFLAMVGFLGVAAFTSSASAAELRGRVVPAVRVAHVERGRFAGRRVGFGLEGARFARYDRVAYRGGFVRRGEWNRGGWRRGPVTPYRCR